MQKKYVDAITLDLTENCNLRCAYCFTSGKTKKKMSFNTAKKAIRWFLSPQVSGKEHHVKITFWGGEPTLEFPMIKRIVSYVRKIEPYYNKQVSFNMTTNGMNLTRENIEYFMQNNISYMISVDGVGERNAYRKTISGENSFETILERLKLSKSMNPKTNIRLTLTPSNIRYLFEDIMWFKKNVGIELFHFSPAFEFDWTEDDCKAAREAFEKLRDEIIRTYNNGEHLKLKPLGFGIPSLEARAEQTHPCGSGRNYLSISTEGAIYPCHRFHDFCDKRPWKKQEKCYGHISKGITNIEFQSSIVNFPDNLLEQNKKCAACEIYKKGCWGGCYATNHDMTGSIFTGTDFQCTFAKLQAEYSQKLFDALQSNVQYLTDYLSRYELKILQRTINKHLLDITKMVEMLPKDKDVPRDIVDFLILMLRTRLIEKPR